MRRADSHKGENGKVMVIGGSRYQHGAPIMSALAAERSGVDLVYLALPKVHAKIARTFSLNFQVHPFHDDELTKNDLEMLLELMATVDAAMIGPGIGRDSETLQVLRELIAEAPCPLVLDASALQPWTLGDVKGKDAILTPHLGELERMRVTLEDIGNNAKEFQCTMHVKGMVDHIAASDGCVTDVSGGNAGLTVGGTGDTLAGLIAGLRSQGMNAKEACVTATTVIKRAGTVLAETQGYSYRAIDVIEEIPHLLHTLVS